MFSEDLEKYALFDELHLHRLAEGSHADCIYLSSRIFLADLRKGLIQSCSLNTYYSNEF